MVSDSEHPPKHDAKLILKKGLHNLTFFSFYMGLNGLVFIGLNTLATTYPPYSEEIITLKIIITCFLNIFPLAAMINVLLHDEKVKYGFKIKQVASLILNLKTSKFIWIILISLILEQLFAFNFTPSEGFHMMDGVILILNLFIIPVMYTFLEFVQTIATVFSNEKKYREKLLAKK